MHCIWSFQSFHRDPSLLNLTMMFVTIFLFTVLASFTEARQYIEWRASTGAPSLLGWDCSATSGDGARALVGSMGGEYLYMTTDSGESWQLAGLGVSLDAYGVAMNFAGSHAIVVGASSEGGKIWRSDDFMSTWYESDGPDTTIVMQSVAMSGNGSHAYAAENGGVVWYSNDYGASFFPTTSLMLDWTAIKCSSSGEVIIAVSEVHGIYYSHNFGDTWDPSDAPHSAWGGALAMSAEGDIVVAGQSSAGQIYVSKNYGVTWTESTHVRDPKYWRTVACDRTCQHILAAGDGTAMYISRDFGASWDTDGDSDFVWKGLLVNDPGLNAIVFRAADNHDGTYNDMTIYYASYIFGVVSSTDDGDGGSGATSSAMVVIIVVPCVVGGLALIVLLYCLCCVQRARAATLSGHPALRPVYAAVQTAPSAPPQMPNMLIPSRDVQMVDLPTSGVGKGVDDGGGGYHGNRDQEMGMGGYGNGVQAVNVGGAYYGYAVMAVAVPVEDSSHMLGASAPPLSYAGAK